MTDSDQQAEGWAKFPDAEHYQANALTGQVRSLPRRAGGRDYPGTDPLKCRPDGDGYMRFNYRDDKGVRHEGASRARCMLMAHDPDGYFPGAEACHGDGGNQDDRLANLRWDTKDANREEALALRLVNSPPKVKPPKVCPRCGAEHRDKGQNCHACVVQLGIDSALLLAAEPNLKKAAETLEYPSTEGVFNLAVRYGGLRCVVDPHVGLSLKTGEGKSAFAREAVAALRHAPSRRSRLRRVLFRREASGQDSDAR